MLKAKTDMILLVFILSVVIISTQGILVNVDHNEEFSQLELKPKIQFTDHDPILIVNNSNFEDYGFSGNGTVVNPYSIENLSIQSTSTNLLTISDTNAHFVIVNCLLDGVSTIYGKDGICLDNVTNGVIRNNTVKNFIDGISVVESDYIVAENNTAIGCDNGFRISDSSYGNYSRNYAYNGANFGVQMEFGVHNTFTNNNMSQNQIDGMMLYNVASCSLINNTLSYNDGMGLYITSSYTDNLILGNNIHHNAVYGIRVRDCEKVNISNNIIRNNQILGIYLNMANKNSILNNSFFHNTDGIGFEESSWNKIINNSIESNDTGLLFNQGGYSGNNNIIGNNIFSGYYGVYLREFNDNNSFVGNSIHNMSQYGFRFYSSSGGDNTKNITLIENAFYFIDGYGIYANGENLTINRNIFYYTDNEALFCDKVRYSQIHNNTFLQNNDYGIYVSICSFISLNYNNFLDSSGTSGQAFSASVDNIEFLFNYWDDLPVVDIDQDGFNDDPYDIGGGSGMEDSYPRVVKNFPIPIDHVVEVELLYPNGGEELHAVTSVNWVEKRGALDLEYHYDLNISSDGNTWISLATDLTNNSFVWNTSEYTDSNYTLKLVVSCPTLSLTKEIKSESNFTIYNPFHTLSTPVVTYPKGGEVLTGVIDITWTTSIDSLGHAVTYEASYSPDNGLTWIVLQSKLNSTTVSWNTETIENDSNYLIMITTNCSTGYIRSNTSESTFTIDNVVHTMTSPFIISPNGNEVLTGVITIEWSPVEDSLDHFITYTAFYSSDGGVNWIIIKNSLNSSTTQWNTSMVLNGHSYLVKIISNCSAGYSSEDISDGTFSINNEDTSTTTTTPSSTTTTISITPSDTTNTSSETSTSSIFTSKSTMLELEIIVLGLLIISILLKKR